MAAPMARRQIGREACTRRAHRNLAVSRTTEGLSRPALTCIVRAATLPSSPRQDWPSGQGQGVRQMSKDKGHDVEARKVEDDEDVEGNSFLMGTSVAGDMARIRSRE